LSGSVVLKRDKYLSKVTNSLDVPQPVDSELVAAVYYLVQNGRRVTVHEVAEEVKISHGSCLAVLAKDFGTRHVSAKFLP
jgi:hypothetical protein